MSTNATIIAISGYKRVVFKTFVKADKGIAVKIISLLPDEV
jgi:hypothetical protein